MLAQLKFEICTNVGNSMLTLKIEFDPCGSKSTYCNLDFEHSKANYVLFKWIILWVSDELLIISNNETRKATNEVINVDSWFIVRHSRSTFFFFDSTLVWTLSDKKKWASIINLRNLIDKYRFLSLKEGLKRC